MVFGLIILAVGIIALLVKLDVLGGSVWDYTWPAILIIIGLSFFLGRFRHYRRWWWFGGHPWDDWGRGKRDDRDKDKNE
jgi:hypothetical protein